MTTDSNTWCDPASNFLLQFLHPLQQPRSSRRWLRAAPGGPRGEALLAPGTQRLVDGTTKAGDGARDTRRAARRLAPLASTRAGANQGMELPADPQADLRLVQAFLAGKESAVREIAERLQCVPRMLAAENARLGRPLDAHDLADTVQDTMLIVLRKLPTFEGRGVLEAWTFHTCRFELLNAVRRRRRQLPNVAEESAAEATAPDAAREWQRLLAREAIETAFASLGTSDAEVLRLRHFDGLSIDEMAVRTGTSPAGMKARYYRALSRLELVLGAQERRENTDGAA